MTQAWGRCGYVYLPGYAVANGESPALIQDLYVLLGDEWLKKGCFNHYLYISAADEQVIDALFDLGFGKERVDALMDLRTAVIPEVEGFSIQHNTLFCNHQFLSTILTFQHFRRGEELRHLT